MCEQGLKAIVSYSMLFLHMLICSYLGYHKTAIFYNLDYYINPAFYVIHTFSFSLWCSISIIAQHIE